MKGEEKGKSLSLAAYGSAQPDYTYYFLFVNNYKRMKELFLKKICFE